MRNNTSEKPYKCIECFKTLSDSGHLSGHMSVHTGKKPCECGECDNTFSCSSALPRYFRSHTG